jgi:integrase
MKAAIYARVSTTDQTCENQLLELRQYAKARGWTVTREYVDEGVSGAKERRLALDALLKDAKRRRLDVVVCWRLDRLGRNLRHLVSRWHQRDALRSYYCLTKLLQLPRTGFHRLRHTFATQYLRNGGGLVRLSIILGHSDVSEFDLGIVHRVAFDTLNPARASAISTMSPPSAETGGGRH